MTHNEFVLFVIELKEQLRETEVALEAARQTALSDWEKGSYQGQQEVLLKTLLRLEKFDES